MVPCRAPRAGGADGVIWVSCHAHDNDMTKNEGHIRHSEHIYAPNELRHGHRLEQAETR
jgi:hypothetical protein